MKLKDAEYAEIQNGNTLVVSCQGDHCSGRIRIPFSPTLDGSPEPRPATTKEGQEFIWTRSGGTTIDDITLSPSINAFECGHFNVINGEISL